MPHTTLKLAAAAALAITSLLSFALDAQATGIITRNPNLTDARCQVIVPGSPEAASLHAIYVTGRTEGMTSPPGGPVNKIVIPLRQRKLQVKRVGCEHPEPLGFVNAGTCGGLPRYRWSGWVVPKGHAYEVLNEGAVLGTVGTVDPAVKLSCPAPPPKPYDVWTDLPGHGQTTTIQVNRTDISHLHAYDFTIKTNAVRGLAKDLHAMSSAYAVASGFTADELLGKGTTVEFEATVSRRRHRYDEVEDRGSRDVVRCVTERFERIELRRPGLDVVWSFEGGVMESRTWGRCR